MPLFMATTFDQTTIKHSMYMQKYPFSILKGPEWVLKFMTEFRQPLQVQSHLEMPGILVQLGHTQRT